MHLRCKLNYGLDKVISAHRGFSNLYILTIKLGSHFKFIFLSKNEMYKHIFLSCIDVLIRIYFRKEVKIVNVSQRN